jgi:NAD(P)H-quinone oxidoreductase subunit 5
MSWVDRYLVDGVVNLVGFATLFTGQSLRYNVTGQTQFYALTIVLGIAAILAILAYGLF